jgi:hypothetical protein
MIVMINICQNYRMFTYPLWRKERVDGLFRQCHTVRFAAQISKLDPHDRIVLGVENQSPDLKNTLPDFNVRLASLQPVAQSEKY